MFTLLPVEPPRTHRETPLAALLHEKVERILTLWTQVDPDIEPHREGVERFVAALSAVEQAVDALSRAGATDLKVRASPVLRGIDGARSYAHLAGLMPRALERVIRFDVAVAVLQRPSGPPVVEVFAREGSCDPAILESVRERALTLMRLFSGGIEPEEIHLPARPASLRSSLYVPLASDGKIVGATYVAAFRENAFSSEDERVLATLASHASGTLRSLEGELGHLRVTGRQSQVLALIASGLSDKEIGSRLGVSHRTVRTHIERFLREHGLRSRTEAATAWLRGQPR